MSPSSDKSRVDHAGGAELFLERAEHLAFHDRRLWELREKRDQQMHGIPEFQELRELASAIKEHTLAKLPEYLEMFERNALANGIHVHWAQDGEEHNRIVLDILRSRNARTVVKSKSMVTEECDMRPWLQARQVEVLETDVGEQIQQFDDEMPSHIVVPAVHKLVRDVAKTFSQAYGTDDGERDVTQLVAAQRRGTRPVILRADAGMTGANFLVAETGAVVVCTNEGNADLSANVPALHIVSTGIEKLVPRAADLAVFIRLLSRSALGSPITQYTTQFRGPRDGGEMHVILVDNGRATRLGMVDFWRSLKCIRCGACMNTCPVYRRSGGLSYGGVYAGPIGAIIQPTFDPDKFSALPFASTLNGSCTNVCPVKIDIHDQLYKWRRIIAEKHYLPFVKREALRMAGRLMARPKLFRAAMKGGNAVLKGLPRFAIYNWLNPWGRHREVPAPPVETFHDWYLRNRKPQTRDRGQPDKGQPDQGDRR
ncbi:MAG TPA: lactate utilization protein B [Stellaceae bacterium]|nr:lactate utilization protein B [Stellaceae bacterium]